jgi:hypothetical protein
MRAPHTSICKISCACTIAWMRARRLALLLLCGMLTAAAPAAAQPDAQAEEFFAAVRAGDLGRVKALLEAGVDVNTKYRYGTTALFPACDRGHTEIVKLLLERGAEVNVRDTFYRATPLTWAATKGNSEIVKLLLDKGAEGVEGVLTTAANRGDAATARVALEKGGLKPETLSSALAAAMRGKHEAIVKLLEEAGAKPPPKPDFQVDAATLASYAGTYRSETQGAPELTFTVRDGKLAGGPPGGNITLGAFDKTSFAVLEVENLRITFRLEGGKVVGLHLRQGGFEAEYKKVEDKKE